MSAKQVTVSVTVRGARLPLVEDLQNGKTIEPTSYCRLELIQESQNEKKPLSDKTNKKVKTRNPDFEHNWTVSSKSLQASLLVELFHYQSLFSKDVLIGKVNLPLQQFADNNVGYDQWFTLEAPDMTPVLSSTTTDSLRAISESNRSKSPRPDEKGGSGKGLTGIEKQISTEKKSGHTRTPSKTGFDKIEKEESYEEKKEKRGHSRTPSKGDIHSVVKEDDKKHHTKDEKERSSVPTPEQKRRNRLSMIVKEPIEVTVGADLEKKILDDFQQVLAYGNPEAELAKISSVGKKWEIVQRMKELEEQKVRLGNKKDVNKIDEGVLEKFDATAEETIDLQIDPATLPPKMRALLKQNTMTTTSRTSADGASSATMPNMPLTSGVMPLLPTPAPPPSAVPPLSLNLDEPEIPNADSPTALSSPKNPKAAFLKRQTGFSDKKLAFGEALPSAAATPLMTPLPTSIAAIAPSSAPAPASKPPASILKVHLPRVETPMTPVLERAASMAVTKLEEPQQFIDYLKRNEYRVDSEFLSALKSKLRHHTFRSAFLSLEGWRQVFDCLAFSLLRARALSAPDTKAKKHIASLATCSRMILESKKYMSRLITSRDLVLNLILSLEYQKLEARTDMLKLFASTCGLASANENDEKINILFADALLYFIPHRNDVWEEMIEDLQDPKNLPFLVVFITFLNTVLAGTPLDLRVDLRQELFDNGLDMETLETNGFQKDLKRDCPDEDLAGQIGIFFTVYEDDLKREEAEAEAADEHSSSVSSAPLVAITNEERQLLQEKTEAARVAAVAAEIERRSAEELKQHLQREKAKMDETNEAMKRALEAERNELALAKQMQQTKSEMDFKKVAQEKQEFVTLQASVSAERSAVEETKRSISREQDALRSEQQMLAAVKKVEEDAKRTFNEARKQFAEERTMTAAEDAKATERLEAEKRELLKQKEELAAERAKKESARAAAESAESSSAEAEERLKQTQARLAAERVELDAKAAVSSEAEKQLSAAKVAFAAEQETLRKLIAETKQRAEDGNRSVDELRQALVEEKEKIAEQQRILDAARASADAEHQRRVAELESNREADRKAKDAERKQREEEEIRRQADFAKRQQEEEEERKRANEERTRQEDERKHLLDERNALLEARKKREEEISLKEKERLAGDSEKTKMKEDRKAKKEEARKAKEADEVARQEQREAEEKKRWQAAEDLHKQLVADVESKVVEAEKRLSQDRAVWMEKEKKLQETSIEREEKIAKSEEQRRQAEEARSVQAQEMKLRIDSLCAQLRDSESTKSGLDAQSKALLAQVDVERQQREDETRKLEAKSRAQLAEMQQKQNEERIALMKEKSQLEENARGIASREAAFAEEKDRVAGLVKKEEENRKVLAEQAKQLEDEKKRWQTDKRAREEEEEKRKEAERDAAKVREAERKTREEEALAHVAETKKRAEEERDEAKKEREKSEKERLAIVTERKELEDLKVKDKEERFKLEQEKRKGEEEKLIAAEAKRQTECEMSAREESIKRGKEQMEAKEKELKKKEEATKAVLDGLKSKFEKDREAAEAEKKAAAAAAREAEEQKRRASEEIAHKEEVLKQELARKQEALKREKEEEDKRRKEDAEKRKEDDERRKKDDEKRQKQEEESRKALQEERRHERDRLAEEARKIAEEKQKFAVETAKKEETLKEQTTVQAMLDVERQHLNESKAKLAEQDTKISDLQKSVTSLTAQLEQKAKDETKRLAEKGERRKLKELANKQKAEEEKKAKETSNVTERKRLMEESRKRLTEAKEQKADETLALTHKKREGDEPAPATTSTGTAATTTPVPSATTTEATGSGGPPPPPGLKGPPPPPGLKGPPPPPGLKGKGDGPPPKKLVNIRLAKVKIDEGAAADGPSGFWRSVAPMVSATIAPRARKEAIENLFEISSSKVAKDTKKQQDKTEGPRVLNGQRMLQIALAKKSVNIPTSDLKKYILLADTVHVSAEILTNIKNALASDANICEEVDSLLTYDGRNGELTSAEQWLAELYTIPRLKPKLAAMMWKHSWKARLAEAEPLRKEVFRAILELKNDLFTKFCGYVLVHANVLNQYSYADRNAQGFELSTLTQLETVKSGDKKTTLLNFIIDEIDKSDPDVLLFDEELAHMESASTALLGFQAVFPEMLHDMVDVGGEAAACASPDEKDFKLAMTAAIEECGDEMWRLNRWLEDVNKTVLYYGDNHLCPYHNINDVVKKSWNEIVMMLKSEAQKSLTKQIVGLIMTSKELEDTSDTAFVSFFTKRAERDIERMSFFKNLSEFLKSFQKRKRFLEAVKRKKVDEEKKKIMIEERKTAQANKKVTRDEKKGKEGGGKDREKDKLDEEDAADMDELFNSMMDKDFMKNITVQARTRADSRAGALPMKSPRGALGSSDTASTIAAARMQLKHRESRADLRTSGGLALPVASVPSPHLLSPVTSPGGGTMKRNALGKSSGTLGRSQSRAVIRTALSSVFADDSK